MSEKKLHFETLQQHAGQVPDPVTGARAVPIYQTTSYVFKDAQEAEDRFALRKPGYIYGRLTNPTQDVLEKRLAALEGGTAGLAVASGAAAVTYSILNIAGAGDEIVAASTLYGGTYELLPIHCRSSELRHISWILIIRKKSKRRLRQRQKQSISKHWEIRPSNIPDFDLIRDIAHAKNLPVLVDNTFATPYLFRPLEHGLDVSIHSTTKFIGGHGTTLGGAIIENGEFNWNQPERYPHFAKPDASYHGINFATDIPGAGFVTRIRAKVLRDTGAAISPISAWFFIQGLETLSLRVERHVYNATKVAEYLEAHPKVAKVNYPGLKSSPYHKLQEKYLPKGAGSIFSIELKDGFEAARKFIDNLEIFSDLANVGDSKSLVVHPASTTHQQLDEAAQKAAGITPGTVRISVGIENVDDLLNDLEQALARI